MRIRAALTAVSTAGAPSGGWRGTYDAIRIPPTTTRASDPIASSATGGKRRAAPGLVAAATGSALTGSPPWS